MNYNTSQQLPIYKITHSLEKQLNQGFKIFIRSLLTGNKQPVENKDVLHTIPKRNYFLNKYQQLLNNGKTGNVQVINIEKSPVNEKDKKVVVYVTYQLLSKQGVRLFTSVAMATRENIPAINTIIPIYYNPGDFSVIVLL